jgi:hypothetical protein
MIKEESRVIDKATGCRGVIRRRIKRKIIVDWDNGTDGELPWPIREFVLETPKNYLKYKCREARYD